MLWFQGKIDHYNFSKPIKRNILQNFIESTIICNKTMRDGRIKMIKRERNIFIKVWNVACNHNIELKTILSYPLTPVPLSLCNKDGNMNKTNRAVLLKNLGTNVNSSSSFIIDSALIDGGTLFHMMGDIPQTYLVVYTDWFWRNSVCITPPTFELYLISIQKRFGTIQTW